MSVDRSYEQRLIDFMPTPQELAAFAQSPEAGKLIDTFERLRQWFALLSRVRAGENANVLLASAHSKIIEMWALIPLSLYHSAYTSLRTMIDLCTSYTFYCSHKLEWNAVCTGKADWEGRGHIIDWHIKFTPYFKEANRATGLSDRLNADYEVLSSYVHGLPYSGLATWTGLQKDAYAPAKLEEFNKKADKVVDDLNVLFVCVFHQYLSTIESPDYRKIMRGIDRRQLSSSGLTLPAS